MLLDFSKLDTTSIYKLISNTVTPRPIAWISTEHNGITNLAPFSYFIPLSSEPPMLIVSIGKKEDGSPKDTLANFLNGSKATINFVSKELKDVMSQSATSLAYEQSEFEQFGISGHKVLPNYPMVVEGTHAVFFCSFVKTMPIEGSETTPCLLLVEHAYYADGVIDKALHVKLDNIGRVGSKFLVDGSLVL
ncbi:flavin reductase family protein [Sulfurospirillum diekertiae]|uniref:Flavin reductase family protein n=1 Tax=Sulfurospirillum diekertiae TaxID=1854492 RepID=A0A6G9VS19_9BACT|nr:flavin reductase family protein [Sulfurospirillum diekertiae]QIR75658.1 flavin reductase family protein [Sulfurospirillum diekertiae]QIR78307.1 flavin reductase family protein [Sulfurospirillum diekertiae]